MHRFFLAFLCFFRVLLGKPLPADLLPAPTQAPSKPARLPAPRAAQIAEADCNSGALQLLQIFQREGRLLDFLSESLDGYDDATVGAAARDVPRVLKKALDEHVSVEPVMSGAENDTISVAQGFDPQRIRLTGNVAGTPPFRGVLRHHGWHAKNVSLPQTNEGMDLHVVCPAEVELS